MVNITNSKEKCFAYRKTSRKTTCTALAKMQKNCSNKCRFFKPSGCEDWVRREVGNEIWLIPPEEYYAEHAERK